MNETPRLICVGVFGAPHGVKGVVKLRSFTADPETILEFDSLQDAHGKPVQLHFIGHSGEALLVQVPGVSDRNAAQLLTHQKLFVLREALPTADEDDGEFYIEDLIGLSVKLADGRSIGKVLAVHNFGAGDIVEIAFNNGTQEMFSFTDATFPKVDIGGGFLELNTPEIIEARKS